MPSLYEKGGVARRRQSCIAYPDGPEHSQNFPSGVTRDMDNIYDRSELGPSCRRDGKRAFRFHCLELLCPTLAMKPCPLHLVVGQRSCLAV